MGPPIKRTGNRAVVDQLADWRAGDPPTSTVRDRKASGPLGSRTGDPPTLKGRS